MTYSCMQFTIIDTSNFPGFLATKTEGVLTPLNPSSESESVDDIAAVLLVINPQLL